MDEMKSEFWNPPEHWPRFDAWIPSERDVSSEVKFWKKSSDPHGSVPIPAAGGGNVVEENSGRRKQPVTYWKPVFELNWKPPPIVWKWTPSSESDQVGGLWKWKPSSQGTSDWKWTCLDKALGVWKFGPDKVPGLFGRKLPPLPILPIPPGNPVSVPSSLPLPKLPKPPASDPRLNNLSDFSYLPASFHTKDESVEIYNRRHRRHDALLFIKEYLLVHGRRTTISSKAIESHLCPSYDASWVAVHGTDSICVVTRRKDLDMTRVGSFFQRSCSNRQTLSKLVEAVISEVECLPYDEELLCKMPDMSEGPFGVVSVIPVTKNVDAESGLEVSKFAEYNDEKAIVFLVEKTKSGLAFTFDQTIQTAISAFQHLCPETKLKAIDIWVTVWNERRTEHLHLKQIKEHLNVIRGVSHGGVSSSSVVSHGSSYSSTDSNSESPLIWSVMMEEVAAEKRRLACRCGSKVCGGNGFEPCETGLIWEKWFRALRL